MTKTHLSLPSCLLNSPKYFLVNEPAGYNTSRVIKIPAKYLPEQKEIYRMKFYFNLCMN